MKRCEFTTTRLSCNCVNIAELIRSHSKMFWSVENISTTVGYFEAYCRVETYFHTLAHSLCLSLSFT